MGCFGSKEAQKDNFSGTGRVLGSTPAPRTSAPIPSTTSQSRPTASSGAPGQTIGPPSTGDDPRAAAARAAETRASKQPGTTKLEQSLAAQKKGGMQRALKDASYEIQRHREIDDQERERKWS